MANNTVTLTKVSDRYGNRDDNKYVYTISKNPTVRKISTKRGQQRVMILNDPNQQSVRRQDSNGQTSSRPLLGLVFLSISVILISMILIMMLSMLKQIDTTEQEETLSRKRKITRTMIERKQGEYVRIGKQQVNPPLMKDQDSYYWYLHKAAFRDTDFDRSHGVKIRYQEPLANRQYRHDTEEGVKAFSDEDVESEEERIMEWRRRSATEEVGTVYKDAKNRNSKINTEPRSGGYFGKEYRKVNNPDGVVLDKIIIEEVIEEDGEDEGIVTEEDWDQINDYVETSELRERDKQRRMRYRETRDMGIPSSRRVNNSGTTQQESEQSFDRRTSEQQRTGYTSDHKTDDKGKRAFTKRDAEKVVGTKVFNSKDPYLKKLAEGLGIDESDVDIIYQDSDEEEEPLLYNKQRSPTRLNNTPVGRNSRDHSTSKLMSSLGNAISDTLTQYAEDVVTDAIVQGIEGMVTNGDHELSSGRRSTVRKRTSDIGDEDTLSTIVEDIYRPLVREGINQSLRDKHRVGNMLSGMVEAMKNDASLTDSEVLLSQLD